MLLHDVNLLSVISPDFSFVQRAKFCKQSRFDKNIVLPLERTGRELSASIVILLGYLAAGILERWKPFEAMDPAVKHNAASLRL